MDEGVSDDESELKSAQTTEVWDFPEEFPGGDVEYNVNIDGIDTKYSQVAIDVTQVLIEIKASLGNRGKEHIDIDELRETDIELLSNDVNVLKNTIKNGAFPLCVLTRVPENIAEMV